MGLLALSGGIYGLTNPLAFSPVLGIPVASPYSLTLPFISFTAARNLGSGITMLTLLAAGQRKAVGLCMMCGVVTAISDAWICAKFGATKGKARGHAVMGVLAGALGAGMWWMN
jgi:hypothetical protein